MARKNVKNQKHKSQVHNSTNRKSGMNKMELRDYVDAFNKSAYRHYETKYFEKALEVLKKKYKHLEDQLQMTRLSVEPQKFIEIFTMHIKALIEIAEVWKKLGKFEVALYIYNMAGSKIQAFIEKNVRRIKTEKVIEMLSIEMIIQYEYAKMKIKDRNFKSAQERLSPCLATFENNPPNYFKNMKKIDFIHKNFDMMELWSKISVVLPKCYYEDEKRAKKGHLDEIRKVGLPANCAMVGIIVGQAFEKCD